MIAVSTMNVTWCVISSDATPNGTAAINDTPIAWAWPPCRGGG